MNVLTKLLVDLGVNLTSFRAGLTQATASLQGVQPTVQQLSRGFANAATVNYLLIRSIQQVGSAIKTSFVAGIKSADDYRLATINVAATLTDMTDKSVDKQQAFNTHLAQAKLMYKELELVAVKHFASGKELQLAWTLLAQRGITLRYEEIEALSVIVDKVKLITQGQASTVQISQELRSLLNGQARVTDQLARLLYDKYGQAWGEIVRKHREAGDLIVWLAKEYEGLAIASGHIYQTLEAQATTLWTMLRRVGREGLGGAYDYIVQTLRTINEYLIENEGAVSEGIFKAWLGVKIIVDALANSLRELFGFLSGNSDTIASGWVALGTGIAYLINLITSLIQTIYKWIEAHWQVVATIAAVIVAYEGVLIIISIIESIIALWGKATLAAATFSGALASIGVVATSITGVTAMLTILIGALAIVYGVAMRTAAAIRKVFEEAHMLSKAETLMAPGKAEEIIGEKAKLSPTYKERTKAYVVEQKEAIKYQTEAILLSREKDRLDLEKQKLDKAAVKPEEVIGSYGERLEEQNKAEETYLKKAAELQAKKEDLGRRSREVGLEYFPELNLIRHGMTEYDSRLQLQGEKEKKEAFEQSLKMQKGRTAAEEGGKGAKPKSEYALDKKLLEEQLRTELAAIKAYLDEKKNLYALAIEEMEVNIEKEKASGQDLVNKRKEQADEELKIREEAVEKEKRLNEVEYENKIVALKRDLERGAIEEQEYQNRSLIEFEKYKQRKIAIDKEGKDALMNHRKKEVEADKRALEARKELLNTVQDVMSGLAWGTFEEEAVNLMKIRKEFSEIRKEINALEIGKGELTPGMRTQLMAFAEAARSLNLPWAAGFVEAVNKLLSGTPEEQETARKAIQGYLVKAEDEKAFQNMMKKYIDPITDLFEGLMNELVDIFIDGGKTLKEVLDNFFRAVMKQSFKVGFDMLSQAFNNILRDLFRSILGSVGGGLSFVPGGNIAGGQHGAMIFSPSYIYAGEAGEEAIFPLTKTSRGLGIAAVMPRKAQSQINPINVTVINRTKTEVEPTVNQDNGNLEILLDEMMAKNVGKGGKFTNTMSDVFGLNQKMARRG